MLQSEKYATETVELFENCLKRRNITLDQQDQKLLIKAITILFKFHRGNGAFKNIQEFEVLKNTIATKGVKS